MALKIDIMGFWTMTPWSDVVRIPAVTQIFQISWLQKG